MKFEEKIKLYTVGKQRLEEELELYDGNMAGKELKENFPLIYAVYSVLENDIGYMENGEYKGLKF